MIDRINHLPCVFAAAVRARCAVCELARRDDRAGLACASPLARSACGTLHGLLREKCAFALRVGAAAGALRPAQALRLQCGGLAGLKHALAPAAHAPDVHRLARLAAERGLENLPFEELVKHVAAWKRAS
jgi:hypothetical protein